MRRAGAPTAEGPWTSASSPVGWGSQPSLQGSRTRRDGMREGLPVAFVCLSVFICKAQEKGTG